MWATGPHWLWHCYTGCFDWHWFICLFAITQIHTIRWCWEKQSTCKSYHCIWPRKGPTKWRSRNHGNVLVVSPLRPCILWRHRSLKGLIWLGKACAFAFAIKMVCFSEGGCPGVSPHLCQPVPHRLIQFPRLNVIDSAFYNSASQVQPPSFNVVHSAF